MHQLLKQTISIGLFMAFLFHGTNLNAQDWMPFHPGDTAHYVSDTASFISQTIWVDSVQISGSDTLYFFNRVSQAGTDTSNGWPISILEVNRAQSFQFSMKALVAGLYLFEGPQNFWLHSLKGVGESWFWDDDQTITATVLTIDTLSVMGILDSVKTIGLDNGDEVLLSKTHGLLQLPEDSTGLDIRLVGLENRGLGIRYPAFQDFFSFNVGDVFFHFDSQAESDFAQANTTRSKVIAKSIMGDTIRYTVDVFGKSLIRFGPGQDGYWYPYGPFTKEWVFIDSARHLSNFQHLELGAMPDGYWQGTAWREARGPMVATEFQKEMDQMYTPSDTGNIWNVSGFYFLVRYEVGLGITKLEGFGGLSSHDFELLGAIIDGDTIGTFLSDSLLTASVETALEPGTVSCYPNPFAHQLVVEVEEYRYLPGMLRLRDVQGRLLEEREITGPYTELEWTHLGKGLYILEFAVPGQGIYRQKLLKE